MSYITTWMQNNYATKGLYKTAKKIANKGMFSVQDLNRIQCLESANMNRRLNIVLPTVNRYKIFGGIATALKVFDILATEMNADVRIIVNRKETYNRKFSLQREGYTYNTGKGKKQFIFLADKNNQLAVRNEDIFLCTSWDTAYCIEPVIRWKKEHYSTEEKLIYLIQDFEPGFYAWSTQYLLADSTYRNNDIATVAVFNSKELYDFFKLRNYTFYKSVYFPPRLNSELASYLIKHKNHVNKKKRILIYGRPGTERNAFSLISFALQLWAESFPNAIDWEIISLGETFDDIRLPNGIVMKCLGKASLEEYARIMLESYIGISLMVSPHPSYPPLEMATFGIKTITNQFENKNLRDFSENIISLEKCTPEVICSNLEKLCALYPKCIAEINTDTAYVSDLHALLTVVKEVAQEF